MSVRDEGDAALYRFARTLDHAEVAPGGLKVTPAEFDAAFGMVAPEVIEAIRYAIGNIRNFHETQKPEPMWLKEIRPGAFAGDRWTPIQSVALYVPRGKGAFPSVTMMTSVPAVIAGVPNVAICTPPAPDGSVDLDPISIVCKVTSVDGRPAVKLSDNPEKATGNPAEVERYLRVFGNAGRVRSAVHV